MPTTSEDFLTIVAAHFIKLRGRGTMLSPADLELLARWERRGIPAAAAARGITAAFQRGGEIRALEQCAWAVEAQLLTAVSPGGTKSTPPASPAALAKKLDALATALERGAVPASAAPVLAKAAAEVRRLAHDIGAEASCDAEALRRLRDVEEALLQDLAGRLPRGDLERFRAEAARALAGREVAPEVAGRTQDAIVTTKIRRHFNIPRLSL